MGWTATEVAALKDRALSQARNRPEILAELRKVTGSAFWITYRYAAWDRVPLDVVQEWTGTMAHAGGSLIVCPDCGPVLVNANVLDNGRPLAGPCPQCGDALYFG